MHVRCPHCHNPIDLVDDIPLTDLTCPSCGSHFNLISGESTARYDQNRAKTVGRFELVEQVGLGRFGSVWKARDPELAREVAVKIPRDQTLLPAERELFFREARAAAQLRHPNIVSVHEVGRDATDTIYIVSDFIDGADLREWLTGQRLTSREAAELIIQIAEAVHYAHESGVIHRDLKPGNVMLDIDGRPHVTDFGLARREAGEITMTLDGRIIGTPAYMSPEQARGEGHTADRRSDVYSLGVILFELLTGELPFRGEQRMLVVQILRDEPPSPRKLNNRIPRDLETICLKCLEKDADRRYPTAQELAGDLGRFLKGEPIAARPISRPQRAWRWCQRNPRVASLTAAILLLLLTVAAGSTLAAIRIEAERRRADIARELAQKAQFEQARALEAEIAQRNQAEYESYCASIALAEQRILDHRFDLAIDLLFNCPERFKNWEWGRLQYLCHQEQKVFTHEGGVTSVDVSSDGSKILSASDHGTATLWDLSSRRLLHTFRGQHQGTVHSARFSHDGSRIVTAGQDGAVVVWDVESGSVVSRFRGHSGAVNFALFSPDDRSVVSASSDHTAQRWNVDTGELVATFEGHAGDVLCLDFSPDGRYLATASLDKTARVWDLAAATIVNTFEGHTSRVIGVHFSPDGRYLATASGDWSVKVWDANRGEELTTIRVIMGWTHRTLFSEDGEKLIIVGGDRNVYIVKWRTGRVLRELHAHSHWISDVSVLPDGDSFFTASQDGTLKFWQMAPQHEPTVFRRYPGELTTATFSRENTVVLAGLKDRRLRTWQLGSEEERILSTDVEIAGIRSVAFGDGGNLLAAATADGEVIIWQTSTGRELLRISSVPAGILSVVFSSDGAYLALGLANDRIAIYDATTGGLLYIIPGYATSLFRAALSPDGRYVATARERSANIIELIEIRSQRVIQEYAGDSAPIRCLAFSPDMKLLASGSQDRTITLWEVDSGRKFHTLNRDNLPAICICFSPSGDRLASSGPAATHLWDTRTLRDYLTLDQGPRYYGDMSTVSFSPDGRGLLSANDQGSVSYWPAFPWQDEDYPGDPSLSLRQRVDRFRLEEAHLDSDIEATTVLEIDDGTNEHTKSEVQSRFHRPNRLSQETDPTEAAAGLDMALNLMEDAASHREAGQLDESLEAYLKAIHIWETLVQERPDVKTHRKRLADIVHELGNLYLEARRPDQAEDQFRRAIGLRGDLLGSEHIDTLYSRMHLGCALRYQDRRTKILEAETVFRELVEVLTNTQGKEHIETLRAVEELAWTLRQKGDLAGEEEAITEAEQLFTKLIESHRRLHGNEDSQTLRSLANLAEFQRCHRDTKWGEAEATLRKVLDIQRRVVGMEHPDTRLTMSRLAHLLNGIGVTREAEPLLQEVLDVQERSLGEDAWDTLSTMQELAGFKMQLGKLDEAERLFRRYVRLCKQEFPACSSELANGRCQLGGVLLRLGQLEEAEQLLLESYPVLLESQGKQHWQTKINVQYLIDLYQALGQVDQVAEYQDVLDDDE